LASARRHRSVLSHCLQTFIQPASAQSVP
jgi:hypothetical protein